MRDTLGQRAQASEELTRQAAAEGAELVVWPETSVPGSLDLDPELRRRVAQLARESRVALVVGSVGIEPDPITGGRRYFDSAFVVHADGSPGERYDKTHLVPFGEYVPLRELLGRFVAALARGIATTDVVPGERPRAVEVLLADGRRLRVGTPICYELLFPDRVRRFAADGGSVLLGMTNDAWYGRTGAPYQFFAMTALRAAETGVWTARAANTGVSGFIRGDGMGLEQTPVFEAAYRVADVPLHPDPARATFYVRHGDVFAWACWLAVAVLVARARMSDPPAVRAGPTEAG